MFTNLRRALSSTQTCRSLRYVSTPFQLSGRFLSTSRILYAPRIVYVGNLPFNTELAELKDRAEPFGALARITMPNDYLNRPAGFANIEFQDETSAQKFFDAVKQEGLELGGRRAVPALVETHQERKISSPSVTLHISNFPTQPTTEQMEALFAPFGKDVVDIRIGQGYTRPYAHVQFLTQEAAVAAHDALRADPPLVENYTLSVDFSAQKTQRREERTPNATLYFRGIVSHSTLQELLRPHADDIERISFLRQEVHRKHKAGHITCRSVEAATEVMEAYSDKILLEYALEKRNDRTQQRNPRRSRRFSENHEDEAPASASRSTYGGDWNGGERSETYYRRNE